ncbi:FAD-binding oxidoreductase [Parendozoicomonas haliclonae]|uniref:D-2-hydroxyglutarate dehydrogenase n=1 Tax=Parendozoicomonas haliclonae TaxID=1960125 RepID=A0A1X7AJE5_9GAMM|nr:FAD-binding oxidoreductase [Parendozoicomonas haliclonae]SMA45908.1 putative FAD-linked oxidoreductase [Parendozoicomonas haliclonae]
MNKEQLISLLKATLAELTGSEPKVLTDDDSLVNYGRDWTRFLDPSPLAVVLPASIEEVQAITRFANEHKIGLVPSGGRTGLSAAAVATNGEIVVAFDRMNTISGFNAIDRTVACGPGVITEQLQQFAEDQGLFYPVDFASSGSSQIGGNIATNAGGIKVIRYGMTRDWVAGLKVVTGTSELLELNNGLMKNNTGYDLQQLFIGAEGTLGFIVEATMRLARPPQELTVLMLGAEDMDGVMSILKTFQEKMDLTAFEFFSEQALSKVVEHSGIPRPFETPTPFYALLEFECTSEAVSDTAMELFEHCMEQGWVLDGVMSQSLQQLQNLWRCREDISETITRWTPYKNDISVVVSKVPGFLAEIDDVVSREYPDFEIIWFGHIGDGNLHLNILKPDALDREEFLQQCNRVSKWIFEIVQNYGGSVSAEHGVGLLKKDYLTYTRSAAEIEMMRGIKKVFDPNGIMNPGKIFDL